MNNRFLEYVQNYKEDFEFSQAENLTYVQYGISVNITLHEFYDGFNRRFKADVSLQKGDAKYECECIEHNVYQAILTQLMHNGKSYLMFRKTLYGFTLLDPDTLSEVYDYFPEKVGVEESESYIICEVKNFGDLWIMAGCYWGSPYFFSAYDYSKKLFLDLSDNFTFTYGNGNIEVIGDTLILHGEDEKYLPETRKFTLTELNRMVDEKGLPDLYS